MTNYERYKDSSLEEFKEYMKEWLEAEYVEPKVDWNKVPMGTPVMVWDDEDNKRINGRYIVYGGNCPYPHYVLTGKKDIAPFKHAELIMV